MQYDKPTLAKMARDLGLKLPGNTIKAEYILAIEQARAEASKVAEPETPSAAATDAADASSPADDATEPAATEPAAPATPVESAPVVEDHKQEDTPVDDGPPLALEDLAASAVATPVVATEVGDVDPATGEITAPMSEEEVVKAVGGTVLSVTEDAETEAVAPPAAPAPATPPPAAASTSGRPDLCQREGCGKALAGENQDFVKLSQIKYRMYLCNDDYVSRKKGNGPHDRQLLEARQQLEAQHRQLLARQLLEVLRHLQHAHGLGRNTNWDCSSSPSTRLT